MASAIEEVLGNVEPLSFRTSGASAVCCLLPANCPRTITMPYLIPPGHEDVLSTLLSRPGTLSEPQDFLRNATLLAACLSSAIEAEVLSAVSCLLSVVCCQLSTVYCLLSIVCCLLSAACCLLHAVCCMPLYFTPALSANEAEVLALLSTILFFYVASHIIELSFGPADYPNPQKWLNIRPGNCSRTISIESFHFLLVV
jgi:hypothetical protein